MIMDTNSPGRDHWWTQLRSGHRRGMATACARKGGSSSPSPGPLVEVQYSASHLARPAGAGSMPGFYADHMGAALYNPLAGNVKNNKEGVQGRPGSISSAAEAAWPGCARGSG